MIDRRPPAESKVISPAETHVRGRYLFRFKTGLEVFATIDKSSAAEVSLGGIQNAATKRWTAEQFDFQWTDVETITEIV